MNRLTGKWFESGAVGRLRARSGYLATCDTSQDFIVSASSTWLQVTATASATPHTKGSWTEVIAATSRDFYGLSFSLRAVISQAGTDTSTLADVGIGSAGSEQVIIPDMNLGFAWPGNGFNCPVFIPAGSRLAVRCQSIIASKTVNLAFRGLGRREKLLPPKHCVAIGVDSANSRGTVLSDGGLGIKGSWSELTPSCPETLSAFVVFVGGGGDTVMGSSAGMGGVDIGVGAFGSEQVINHNLLMTSENNEAIKLGGAAKVYGCMIPKGARVTARWSQNVSTTSVDVSLVGIPWRP